MSRNSYSNPKLYIEDKLIPECLNANISFPGKSQVSKLSATIMNPDIEEAALFGKTVTYYMNYGSDDVVPIFRGYITNVSGSETNIKISAVDIRGYLTVDSKKITLSDKNNYDGFTLGQFLKHYIDKFINKDKVYIGTERINDTDPAITLSKKRGTFKVYDLVKKNLSEALDEKDDNEPLDYNIGVLHDEDKSYVTFRKKKRLDDHPSMNFSKSDGIIDIKYKERPRKFVASLKDRNFTYGSNPSGPFNIVVEEQPDDTPEDLRERARKKILKELNNNVSITLTASKGHYINPGSIVYINTDETLVAGPQRVVSKTITINNNAVALTLVLNKEPVEVSEYLNPNI